MTRSESILIRTATQDDEQTLRRLAQLDSERRLAVPALVAEVDGVPRAAVSLANGRMVADPFARTVDIVALLRLRAERLDVSPDRSEPGGGLPLRSLRAALRRPRPALTA